MLIEKLPLELLLMIIEKLRFRDAYRLCKALNISQEMAYQNHIFYSKEYDPEQYDPDEFCDSVE